MAPHVTTPAQSQRLRILRPYLAKLQAWNERIPGTAADRGATIVIGRERMPVDAWERALIARCARPDMQPPEETARLVLEGLAYMAKSLTDIERLGRVASSRETIHQGQAELLLDTAIGTALLREVQQSVDGMVARGELEQARQWNSLMHRMRRVASRTTERITESNLTKVGALADTMTELQEASPARRRPAPRPAAPPPAPRIEIEPEAEDRPTLRPAPAPAPTAPPAIGPVLEELGVSLDEWHERGSREDRPRSSSWARTPALAAALFLAFVAWVAFVAIPSALEFEPKAVTRPDFPAGGEVAAVTSRFPSLFVDVDAAAWDELAHAQRWARIREASGLAADRGYDGLLIRAGDGRPLAQWLRGRGIALLDESADPAPGPRQPLY